MQGGRDEGRQVKLKTRREGGRQAKLKAGKEGRTGEREAGRQEDGGGEGGRQAGSVVRCLF